MTSTSTSANAMAVTDDSQTGCMNPIECLSKDSHVVKGFYMCQQDCNCLDNNCQAKLKTLWLTKSATNEPNGNDGGKPTSQQADQDGGGDAQARSGRSGASPSHAQTSRATGGDDDDEDGFERRPPRPEKKRLDCDRDPANKAAKVNGTPTDDAASEPEGGDSLKQNGEQAHQSRNAHDLATSNAVTGAGDSRRPSQASREDDEGDRRFRPLSHFEDTAGRDEEKSSDVTSDKVEPTDALPPSNQDKMSREMVNRRHQVPSPAPQNELTGPAGGAQAMQPSDADNQDQPLLLQCEGVAEARIDGPGLEEGSTETLQGDHPSQQGSPNPEDVEHEERLNRLKCSISADMNRNNVTAVANSLSELLAGESATTVVHATLSQDCVTTGDGQAADACAERIEKTEETIEKLKVNMNKDRIIEGQEGVVLNDDCMRALGLLLVGIFTLMEGCYMLDEQYEYIRQLGSGTYGTVYLAQDKTTKKKFVCKVMPLMNFIAKEVKYWCKLKHDNINAFLGVVRTGSTVAIFSVFESDMTVEHLANGPCQPLGQGRAFILMKPVLIALKYLHALDIIHGDVKAANVIYIPLDCVKLIDFGLANAINGYRQRLESTDIKGAFNMLIGLLGYKRNDVRAESLPYLHPDLLRCVLAMKYDLKNDDVSAAKILARWPSDDLEKSMYSVLAVEEEVGDLSHEVPRGPPTHDYI